MSDLPQCVHLKAHLQETSEVVCNSNRFAVRGPATRPDSICPTCPFRNVPNYKKSDRARWDAEAEQKVRQFRGLGDLLEAGLRKLGVKKKGGCGCNKRQAWLNKWFPFKRKS